MTTLLAITAVVAFAVAGAALALLLHRRITALGQTLADTLQTAARDARETDLQTTIDTVTRLADQRLSAATDRAAADLEQATALMRDLEKSRNQQTAALAEQITGTAQQTATLTDLTRSLREALSSTSARGQWGERMADDVLALAGFIEGVNYTRQTQTTDGGRPDYTFNLPRGLHLHMDVKFPLSAYLRHLETQNPQEAEQHRRQFLRDARNRVDELARRDYIDPATSIDCVLLFIPNEQVYGSLHRHDQTLLDHALRNRIVLCSPLTLFAVLAVIRQAADNFQLEKTSDEILALLGRFNQQWAKFCDGLDTLGKRLETVQRGYDDVAGTRRRQLEKPLEKLDDLRRARDIPADTDPGEPPHLMAATDPMTGRS